MPADTAVELEVTLRDGTRRRVRARSWIQVLEATLGPDAWPAPEETWQVVGTRDGVRVSMGVDTIEIRRVAVPEQTAPTGLQGAGTVAEAARVALALAPKHPPTESSAVLLAVGPHLRFVAATGPRGSSLQGVRISASTGVAGHVMTTQRSVLLGAAGDDPHHYEDFDSLTGYQTGPLVAVPVYHQGVAYGVMELLNPLGAEPFDPGQLDWMERLGRTLGRVIAGLRSG